jgi:hypothetical protein
MRVNRDFRDGTGRYFYWSALRLDSDPLNRRPAPRTSVGCPDGAEDCLPVEPIWTWVEPGWMAKCFVLAALPAILIAKGTVAGLAQFGVSEITSFFVSMPILTLAWFYLVGSAFDRRRGK